jgi:hypothetical protein
MTLKIGEIPEKSEIIRIMNACNLTIQKNTIDEQQQSVHGSIGFFHNLTERSPNTFSV